MRNRTYGGVRGRKTKVGRKLLRFPPTRFPYLIKFPRISRVSSLVTERVAALVAFFTTLPVADDLDLVFLPVTLSLT